MSLQGKCDELEGNALRSALDALEGRWSLLILTSAFNGFAHFEEFQSSLGIARNILSSRLHQLVMKGFLSREQMNNDRRKFEYHLTAKGLALMPTLIALRDWGEKWAKCEPPPSHWATGFTSTRAQVLPKTTEFVVA